MFAVLKTGGKQYKVSQNDVIIVEKLSAKAGDIVQFDKIMMIGDEKVHVGDPSIEGAAVQAEVLEQAKGKKVTSFVKRRRKHSSKRTRGHRQNLTVLRVGKILSSGAKNSGEKIEVGVRVIGANTKVEPTKKASAKVEVTKKTSAKAEATKKTSAKSEVTKKTSAKAEATKKTSAKAEATKKTSAKAEVIKKASAKAEVIQRADRNLETAKKPESKVKPSLTKKT